MSAADLHIVTADQLDRRLGRHVVHDPRSRAFAFPRTAVTTKPSAAIRYRIYGPRTTPTQRIGCCTGVDQAVKCDSIGNRLTGAVLNMADAERIYALATTLDPFDGQYPPDDVGSSALGACKAAGQLALIERYEWLFAGAGQVLGALVGGQGRRGRCVGVGTWWYEQMFEPDPLSLLVKPAGKKVGGHQWTVTGWEPRFDAFEGLCWWGPQFGHNGRFRIRFDDLEALLADDGDAHVTYRRTA